MQRYLNGWDVQLGPTGEATATTTSGKPTAATKTTAITITITASATTTPTGAQTVLGQIPSELSGTKIKTEMD